MMLQEELEAYDKHHRQMEDALDQKTATVIYLQKSLNAGGSADGDSGQHVAELLAADASLDSKLAASAAGVSAGGAVGAGAGGSSNGAEGSFASETGMLADGFGRSASGEFKLR